MIITVDVETTGTDPIRNSIVSIGAVVFEDTTKRFSDECRIFDGAHVSDKALEINGFTLEEISRKDKQSEAELIQKFCSWYTSHNSPIVMAGHNTHFDLSFLTAACERAGISSVFGKRVLDQHSLCFASMMKTKYKIPIENGQYMLYSDAVMKYVGIPPEPKPHIAINGALWETEALSRLLIGTSKLDQFKQYLVPKYLV